MPCLRILTNIPSSKIPTDFVNKIMPVLAKVVRKDVEKFSCVIVGDCQLSFAGDSSQPGAISTLESIGHVEPEDNRMIGQELSTFVQQELGIHPKRFFISIYDIKGTNIVKGGDTLN
ncbi:macrophage migration inhibitory factor homolog [Leguminivora glycinivorella]|uniref:macrophage migration inhibitory factor homolog n=1 Tax=Leguminivora glycinivorella TaxID=1035111 RepID=UPI00200E3B34|nr:macrophage migration inhibitory factor homolog [Leguminivora glycinivorella]